MSIDPASPHGPNLDASRLHASRTGQTPPAPQVDPKVQAPASDAKQAQDSVEVSGTARALANKGAAHRSGIAAERLKEISERVANGFYDRPEVIAKVAASLQKDSDFTKQG